jgi:hypothetical protein
MDANDPVFILHRYFIWANQMRTHFDGLLANKTDHFDVESMMYMSLWYGLLYVVIEGWRELHLEDEVINKLLEPGNTELLKRYRNATFHFPQKRTKYLDE